MSDAIIISIIGAITSTIASILAWQSKNQSIKNTAAIKEVHDSVNGKMTQLLEVSKVADTATGKEAGIQQEKEDQQKRDNK